MATVAAVAGPEGVVSICLSCAQIEYQGRCFRASQGLLCWLTIPASF